MPNILNVPIMLSSEQKNELGEKRLKKVKQINPVLKKIIVNMINRFGRILFFFRKNCLPVKVNKILFVSLYFNGDILFHSAVFELARKLYPGAEIHIWIKSRTKNMMSGYPFIRKVFVFDDVRTRRYDEEVRLNLKSKFRFMTELRKENYDMAFDLTGLFWSAFAIWYAGAKYSSGFNFQGFGFLYNTECEAIYKGHLIDKHLNLLLMDPFLRQKISELDHWEKGPKYYITAESVRNVDKIIETLNPDKNKKMIVFHTTAGWDAKTWNVFNYYALAKSLKEHYLIVIIGGNQDTENGKFITENSGNGIIDLTGKLSMNESAEVIRRSKLFIGADSGPLYLAEAVGTKTLSLFGPTNPLFSAPKGKKHRFIYKELFCSAQEDVQNCKLMAGLNCRTIDCMKMISAEEVMTIADAMIKENDE